MAANKQTTKTIARIIETKRRESEAAEAAYAVAHAALLKAEEQRKNAEAAWAKAIDGGAHGSAVALSVADLEDHDRHVRSLRRVVETCERNAQGARAHEAKMRGVMTEARIELRRFEKWLERTTHAHAIEARRVERIAEDEVASRRRLG